MGLFDKAKDFVDKHDTQVDKGLDKLGDIVDERTGHKHSGNIDKAVDAAQKYTGDGDTTKAR
ncbi:antitoxin [Cryptosporangium sp. NPDC048952]|uniref:antitoxin n=1 Tax=Cryptosporangium sp. NPDC048952 TaxID=3363961 RepID=UPI0037231146